MSISRNSPPDPVTLNQWYPLVALAEVAARAEAATMLLGERVLYRVDGGRTEGERELAAWRAGDRSPLPAMGAYGYLWTSLGKPPASLFPIPEWDEPDRRKLNAASIGVAVSAPRAIENFLDMGHFPFVHTDILGAEPHTEVKEYDVEVSAERDEILATPVPLFPAKGLDGLIRRCGRRLRLPGAAPDLLGALQVEPSRREAARRDRAFSAADDSGERSGAHDALRPRRHQRRQGHHPFPADHLRPGQADPGEPVS
jgi:phenylpropionate dioxygenase-like ring-hydroxylating dioxygenase large terminal subunit